jgi:hypothetical protein
MVKGYLNSQLGVVDPHNLGENTGAHKCDLAAFCLLQNLLWAIHLVTAQLGTRWRLDDGSQGKIHVEEDSRDGGTPKLRHCLFRLG